MLLSEMIAKLKIRATHKKLKLKFNDFIWDFRKLPFPSHLGKYFFNIRKISAKYTNLVKKPLLDWE